MIKIDKEKMIGWLETHEKTYWRIVVGLAVFLFALVTVIGFAKPKKANAATDVTCTLKGVSNTYAVWDLSECDWETWSNSDAAIQKYSSPLALREKIVESCEYMIAVYKNDMYTYYFGTSPIALEKSTTYDSYEYVDIILLSAYYSQNYVVKINMVDGVPTIYSVEGLEDLDNWHSLDRTQDTIYKRGNMCVLGSTYDIFEGYTDAIFQTAKAEIPCSNLKYKEVVKSTFFAGGPYLRLNDVYYYNLPFQSSALDNESISGVPMLGNCPYNKWNWTYKGVIGGYLKAYEGTLDDVVSYTKAQCTVEVGVPSRTWVQSCIDNMTVAELRELHTVEKRKEWNVGKYKDDKMESAILPFSKNLMVTPDNKEFELVFSYDELITELAAALGVTDWAAYYGVTDVQWEEYWEHIVFGYISVLQMDSIVFNQYSDTQVMYGCYVSDVFTSGYNYSGYVYMDYFADSQACLSAMKDELSKAFDSVMEESKLKLEEYEAELEAINKELEMLRADEGSLFDMFNSLADGLKNASSGFRSLSVTVGNVFGFFPPEIMACLMFTFIAVLIIAIAKALL